MVKNKSQPEGVPAKRNYGEGGVTPGAPSPTYPTAIVKKKKRDLRHLVAC